MKFPPSRRFEILKRTRFLMMPRETATPPSGQYAASAAEVRALRKASGLSQVAFCKERKVNLRTFQGWEIGRSEPRAEHWKRLRGGKPCK